MNDNSIKNILKVIGDALSVICQRFNDRIAVEKVIEMLYSASRKESSDAGAAKVLENAAKLKFVELFGEASALRWDLLRQLTLNVSDNARKLSLESDDEIKAVVKLRKGSFWRKLIYQIAAEGREEEIRRYMERRKAKKRRVVRLFAFSALMAIFSFSSIGYALNYEDTHWRGIAKGRMECGFRRSKATGEERRKLDEEYQRRTEELNQAGDHVTLWVLFGAAFALVSLGLFGRGIFVIRKQ